MAEMAEVDPTAGEGGAGDEDLALRSEAFLARHDPALRRARGVYATPRPLVLYVVRSVHALLQGRFGRPAGLADAGVRLLDPCAGPMNFLLAAWREALAEATRRGIGERALLGDHLLPHSLGIEILPAAHRLGQLAVRSFLESRGYRSAKGERLPLRLGDALSGPEITRLAQPGVTVVLGNPPYAGRSANRGPWISELLRGYRLPDGREDEGYYRVDGRPLAERNAKWLQGDAVKFLRFAQWTVDRAGEGLVTFVLNHSCLDAPTFRGLRASLLRTFDEVYVLDLHGDRRKRERQADGRPDENVFRGIAQGIALLLLVKRRGVARRVWRADLYGDREVKLRALVGGSVETTAWTEVTPHPPARLFVATETWLERRYRRELAIPELFAVGTPGIITGRDALLTDLDRRAFEERLSTLRRSGAGEALDGRLLGRLQDDPAWHRRIAPLLVRPFDVRQVLYADYLLARPRRTVMDHMLAGDNLGLLVARQCREDPGAFVTSCLAGHKAVSAYDVNTLFPLLLRCDAPEGSGLPPRIANLRCGVRRQLAGLYGSNLDPIDVLAYVYAVLYSPPYRVRYRRFLQRDFPRIPFPRDRESFGRLAALGRELIDLHTLRDPRLLEPTTRLAGDSRRPLSWRRSVLGQYQEGEARVRLNEDGLGLEGIAPEVWHYRIGGHQVLARWLAARRGRTLRQPEVNELRWAAEALRLTLAVQARLTEEYPRVEEDRASP